MLVYGAILPHSASLHGLVTSNHGFPESIGKSFATVAADLHGRGVRTIVSIGTHPHYRRQGFSAYVAQQYHLGFKDLGDLAHEDSLDVAWDIYHALRERGLGDVPTLHPLEESALDSAHTLPLWLVKQHLPNDYKLRVLCINDAPAASRDEQLAFGQALADALKQQQQPCALIVSQECLQAESTEAAAIEAIKAANLALRYQASGVWSKADPRLETHSPCFAGPVLIAHASFSQPQPWAYEELCFEHTNITSILAARLLPPPER